MAKSPSPFTGMKLTDQTPLGGAGVDQKLFSRPAPLPQQPERQEAHVIEEPKESTKHEAVGTTKPGNREGRTVGNAAPAATEAKEFDLNLPTEKSETFAFTFEELLALAELKTGLSRLLGLDVRVTKIDIIRCAVHMIVADYRQHGEQSFLVARFKTKKPVERTRRKKLR
jgi:hypothetical protein